MKVNFNREDNTKLFYRLLTVFISILFFFIIYRFDGFKKGVGSVINILSPIIYGGIIAYIINMPMDFIERNLNKISGFRKLSFKKKRIISLVLTYLIVIILVVVFFALLIPQIADSVTKLTDMTSDYLKDNKFESWGEFFNKYGVNKKVSDFLTERIAQLTEYLKGVLSKVGPKITGFASGFVSVIFKIGVGFIVSLYVLNDKEHFAAISKKATFAIFPKKVAAKLISIARDIGKTVKQTLTGDLLASIILGIEISVVLLIFKVEGVIIMGILIALTNMIPYIGPIIGAIPVFIMIGVQDIKAAFIFLIAVVIGQQIDGNVVKPRIHSGSIGINSFWILFAIIIGGAMFGIPGMIIGVPIFAVIFGLVKELIEYVLNRKGLPVNTSEYEVDKE